MRRDEGIGSDRKWEVEEGIKFGGTCRNGRSIPVKTCKSISQRSQAGADRSSTIQQVQQVNMVIDKWNRVQRGPRPSLCLFASPPSSTDLRSVVKVALDWCRSHINLHSGQTSARYGRQVDQEHQHHSVMQPIRTDPHPHWIDSWETGGRSHGGGGWNGWLSGSRQQDMYCRYPDGSLTVLYSFMLPTYGPIRALS